MNNTKKLHATNNVHHVKKLARYLLIFSVFLVAIHFSLLIACITWTNIYLVWANVLAFVMAFCLSLAGYFTVTFNRDTKKTTWFKKLFILLVTTVTGFLLHQMLFMMAVEKFGEDSYTTAWCLAIAIVVALFVIIFQVLSFLTSSVKRLGNRKS